MEAIKCSVCGEMTSDFEFCKHCGSSLVQYAVKGIDANSFLPNDDDTKEVMEFIKLAKREGHGPAIYADNERRVFIGLTIKGKDGCIGVYDDSYLCRDKVGIFNQFETFHDKIKGEIDGKFIYFCCGEDIEGGARLFVYIMRLFGHDAFKLKWLEAKKDQPHPLLRANPNIDYYHYSQEGATCPKCGKFSHNIDGCNNCGYIYQNSNKQKRKIDSSDVFVYGLIFVSIILPAIVFVISLIMAIFK